MDSRVFYVATVRVRWVALLVSLALLASGACAAPDRKNVFVLHSYDQEYAWTKRQHEGFVAELARDEATRYGVRAEYLDSKRVRYDAAFAAMMAAHLAEKYRGYAPEAVYVTDDNAFVFALDHLSRLFPSAPIVFSSVNDFGMKARIDRTRVTGVFERKEIAPNLELLRQLAPGVSDIVVVGDASETYRAIEHDVRLELARQPAIRARFVADRSLDRVLQGLREGGERFVVLTTLGTLVNAMGAPMALEDSITAIAAVAGKTVVSMEDAYLFKGVLGGHVTSGVAQGQAAAHLVAQYFSGVPIIDLPPVEKSPNVYLVDEGELQRAGLTLPPQIAARATILNPLPSVYERHQREIVGTLYTLGALFALSLTTMLVVVMRKNRQIGANSRALHDSEEKLRKVIEGLPVVLWMIDREGRFLLSEGKGLEALGLTAGRVVGRSLFDFYRDVPEIVEDTHRVLAGHAFARTRQFGKLTFELRYSPLRGDSGDVRGAIGVAIDVTERKLSEDRLAFLANYDPLTGLCNRLMFRNRLAHAIQTADRQHTQVALLFVDLDNFKTINDSLGHAAGDDLLKQMAARLASVVRATDTVSRLGGDEFTLILESLAQPEEATRVAAQIVEQATQPFLLGAKEVHVTASVGVALYPQDADNADALLMDADAAMYRAKENGRNKFEFFTREINARAHERLELVNQLRRALARGEFTLHYQPKVAIDDDSVVGFEALLHWRNGELGAVAPAVFIPVLEEVGLIVEVGEWVLREACRWAARLPAMAGAPAPGISVNLSAKQFRHPSLDKVVHEALVESGLQPGRLELEITESSLMDLDANQQTLERLKGLGVALSIDDFGTGCSSLSYLKRFPVDRLKIDASFVRDVAADADDAAIVVAIIGLAHHLGLRVVAEGVETRAQFDFLRQHGCDEMQGLLLARPMPADQALSWPDLRRRSGLTA